MRASSAGRSEPVTRLSDRRPRKAPAVPIATSNTAAPITSGIRGASEASTRSTVTPAETIAITLLPCITGTTARTDGPRVPV